MRRDTDDHEPRPIARLEEDGGSQKGLMQLLDSSGPYEPPARSRRQFVTSSAGAGIP